MDEDADRTAGHEEDVRRLPRRTPPPDPPWRPGTHEPLPIEVLARVDDALRAWAARPPERD